MGIEFSTTAEYKAWSSQVKLLQSLYRGITHEVAILMNEIVHTLNDTSPSDPKIIEIRLSQDELNAVENWATKVGLSVVEFARRATLGKVPRELLEYLTHKEAPVTTIAEPDRKEEIANDWIDEPLHPCLNVALDPRKKHQRVCRRTQGLCVIQPHGVTRCNMYEPKKYGQ